MMDGAIKQSFSGRATHTKHINVVTLTLSTPRVSPKLIPHINSYGLMEATNAFTSPWLVKG